MHGGMDGRRNDQGNPAPNSDVFILKLGQQRTYEWQAIELDAASQIPPARISACQSECHKSRVECTNDIKN